MDNKEIIKKLCELAQVDIDAVEAYEQALKNIDVQSVYAKIDEFRNDHIRHINDLSRIIRETGGEPPERTKDFKGFLIKGFTAIRSATGTKGALNAMETNERITNNAYENALSLDIPEHIKAIIDRNYEDEKRHIAYIREVLKSENLSGI